MQQSRVKIKFHFIMVKVSHNNVNVIIVIIRIAVLKVTSTAVFVGLRTFTTGVGMHGLFSLFAGSERILRRFSVFAEEPHKSIITAIEPCSPVFKEAQPRPSNNQNKEREPFIQSNLIVVHNVFLLLVIYCCNKASIRIVPKQKELVSSGYPSHQKVSRLSPYTHTHQHTRTSRTFYIFAGHWRI